MEDPCVRKVTMPIPVMAPKRKPEEGEASNNETNKKLKTLLEDDLSLSDIDETLKSVPDMETQKSVSDLIEIMINDCVKSTTMKDVKDASKDNVENNPAKEKTLKLKNVPAKTKILSKEFISDDDDSDNDVHPKKSLTEEKLENFKNEQSLKLKNAEAREKKTILISPPATTTKKQCRYMFVKKPRKGERCSNLTKTDFCAMHSNKTEKVEKMKNSDVINEKREGIQKAIRELEFNTHEIESKVDSMMDRIQNYTDNSDIKTKLQIIESKLVKLEAEDLKSSTSRTPKKLHKLNKKLVYQLVEKKEKGIVKLQAENRIYLVKLPKHGLSIPEECTNISLKFNKDIKQFEFIKLQN